MAKPLLPALLCKAFFKEGHTFILIKCIYIPSCDGCVCVYVYMLAHHLCYAGKYVVGSRASLASTTNSLTSLFFHSVAHLQSVLQTQKSMRELHFAFFPSRAVTQLSTLCTCINIVLDWNYLFWPSGQFRRQVTSVADELVNPGHLHGS